MALVNAYATTAELREHMGDTGSVMDTDVLERALNTASRSVDQHCSGGAPGMRRFWRDTGVTTRVFRADSQIQAWVMDISTTTGLVVKTDDDADGTFGVTWASSDYQLEPLNQDVAHASDTATPHAWWVLAAVAGRRFPVFTSGRAGLQVTARFGWSAVPDDVKTATLLVAAALVQRNSAPFGVQGFGEFGAVRIARTDPTVAELLERFRKRRPRTWSPQPQAGSLFHWRPVGA